MISPRDNSALYLGSHLWLRHCLNYKAAPRVGLSHFGAVTGEVFWDCKGPTKPQSRLPACWPVKLAQSGPLLRPQDWNLVIAQESRGSFLMTCGYLRGSLGCKELSFLPSQNGSPELGLHHGHSWWQAWGHFWCSGLGSPSSDLGQESKWGEWRKRAKDCSIKAS